MDAALDGNSKQTITARLNTNELVIERLVANPINGALKINNGITGTALANNWAATDGNGRSAWIAVSNSNSKVLIALEADATGALLIDTN